MADNKSLAHPEWPYAGTAHEWRGFVKRDPRYKGAYKGVRVRKLREGELEALQCSLDKIKARQEERKTVYQKQNFGPELP